MDNIEQESSVSVEETTLTDFTLSAEAKVIEEIAHYAVRNLSELSRYEFGDKYVADRLGNVYKIQARKLNTFVCYRISPYITRDSYVEYVLTDKFGKKKHIQGHRIIAGLFLADVPGKEYVNHINGDRQDNRVENLEYVTHSENVKHSWNVLRPQRRRVER